MSEFKELADKYVFFSVKKFVETIKKLHEDNKLPVVPNHYITSLKLYFESKDVFKSKYDKICIKPVILQINDMYDGKVTKPR